MTAMEKRTHRITFCETKYQPIVSGKYKVRLIDIKDNEIGQFEQPVLVFVYEIAEGKYAGCECHDLLNKSKDNEYGVRNKVGKTVVALTGKDLCLWEGCDLFELIGKECWAYIELKINEKTKKFTNKIYRLEALHA